MNQLAIGIDIGGTRTKSGLVNLLTGEVLNIIMHPTQKDQEKQFLFQVGSDIQEHKAFAETAGGQITGIGIGVPSFVDTDGVVDSTYGFLTFMENYPLAGIVQQRFQLRCRVDNDARTVALGEALYGQGKGFNRVLVLTLGTGLGLGFVKDGGFDDELPYSHMGGHITVTQNNHHCYCGKTGCLESLISASGIAYEGDRLHWTEKYPGIRLNAMAIFDAAKNGNDEAKSIVEILLGHLRTGIHNYINLFAPDVVIIGGGIAKGIRPYTTQLKTDAYLKPYTKYTVDVFVSDLQEYAGILGAAALLQI